MYTLKNEDDLLLEVGPGWTALLKDLFASLRETDPDLEIYQVKEKFGGLRFYVGPVTAAGYAAIADAEVKSFTVCELCGAAGEASYGTGWWIKTLCKACFDKREARYVEQRAAAGGSNDS